jgi:hypothetical protein
MNKDRRRMNNAYKFLYSIFLTGLIISPLVTANSLVDEGFREFEELRLRQLQTVKNNSSIVEFTSDGCSGGQSPEFRAVKPKYRQRISRDVK